VIRKKNYAETDSTITVIPGGPKYMFTADGELRSIIRDGKSFDADGERRYTWTGRKVKDDHA